jgi:hypothetical protein
MASGVRSSLQPTVHRLNVKAMDAMVPGAELARFMTHIAVQQVDDSGSPVAWGEHVTDEEYTARRAS